jgi:hypothetical protein
LARGALDDDAAGSSPSMAALLPWPDRASNPASKGCIVEWPTSFAA